MKFSVKQITETIIWKKRYGGGSKEKYLVSLHEYILVYAADIDSLESIEVPVTEEYIKKYYKEKDENFSVRGKYRTHPLEATKTMGDRPNLVFAIEGPNGPIMPKRQWLWSRERVAEAISKGELAFLKNKEGGYSVHTKQYLKDENELFEKVNNSQSLTMFTLNTEQMRSSRFSVMHRSFHFQNLSL